MNRLIGVSIVSVLGWLAGYMLQTLTRARGADGGGRMHLVSVLVLVLT
jgi:hypothetical protein